MARILFALLLAAAPAFTGMAQAQGMQVAFGSAARDGDQPVEVTSETLDVDQNDGTAVFTGNVVIGQGEMRLSAPRVQVVYLDDRSGISRLSATGGVTLVSGEDAAEAREADYDVQSGMIDMRGDVLLVQDTTSLTADKMAVDTVAGTARMSGQVKTVLQSGQEQ